MRGSSRIKSSQSAIPTSSCIRSRQTVCNTVFPHLNLLVCTNVHVASGHGATEQNVTFRLVFSKIRSGVIVIHNPFEESPGASKTTALMTNCRQRNPVAGSCVPYRLIFAASKRAEALGRFQSNTKAPFHCHVRIRCSMGYKKPDSCYKAPLPVRHDGSARKVSTCRHVHEPATQ